MTDITNIIEMVVYIIGAVLGILVIPAAKIWLDSKKVSEEKTALSITREWLEIAASAAEEAARSGLIDKEAKYGYALDILEKHGITFDKATIRALVDSTVWNLFNQFKEDAGDSSASE